MTFIWMELQRIQTRQEESRLLVKSLPLEPDKWMNKENPRSYC